MTQKLSDANDVMQYTEAKAKHGLAVADIEARAAADPDFKNTDKYHQELEKVNSTAIQGISNQQVASKAGVEFQYDTSIASLKISAQFKHKQIAYNQVMLNQNLETMMNNKSNATTLAEAQHQDLKIRDLLTENLQTGTISYAQADKMLKKTNVDGATNAIYTDPAKGRAQIEAGYYSLTGAEKGKLLSQANSLEARKLKEQTELQKEVQYKSEADMALSIAQNNYPSVQTLADGVRSGAISSDFATVVLKNLNSPAAVAAQTDNEEFSKLTQEIFKSKNKEGVQKSIVNILKGGGDGKLSKDDLGVLINSAMLQGNQARADIGNAINSLGDWADKAKLNRASVLRTFQKSVSEGRSVVDASDIAMKKTVVDSVPGAAELNDVPNVLLTPDSPIRYIFPKETKVYPKRIYNPATGKLEANPEVNQDAKRTR